MFNVVSTEPASSAVNRFRIVYKQSSILPVNFTSVTAVKKVRDIQVAWKVATESGIKQYEVEHSLNGTTFNKSADVSTSGKNGTAIYQWLDVNANAGNHYYRIRALQNDGSFLLSQVVLVKMGESDAALKVYPNPLTGNRLNMQLTDLEKDKYNIGLINAKGQQVFMQTMDHPGGSVTKTIDLTNKLPAGVYYLQIKSAKTQLTAVVQAE